MRDVRGGMRRSKGAGAMCVSCIPRPDHKGPFSLPSPSQLCGRDPGGHHKSLRASWPPRK